VNPTVDDPGPRQSGLDKPGTCACVVLWPGAHTCEVATTPRLRARHGVADALGAEVGPERPLACRLRAQTRANVARVHYHSERHGGTVEKFIGDAVMAVFGVPLAHEDDAKRAVRAANELRTRLGRLNGELEARWGVELQWRMGVNTGEVVTDPVATQTIASGD